LPEIIEYEKATIVHDIKLGKMRILFNKNRFIIGLDIIFYLLALEANLATPVIASILLNEKKIYDQADISSWKNQTDKQRAQGELNDFGLGCEQLLFDENIFTINFKTNEDWQPGNRENEFYSFSELLFFKQTSDRDDEFYLRETLDKYKIQY